MEPSSGRMSEIEMVPFCKKEGLIRPSFFFLFFV
nr:MAG TPA: putative cellulose synthase A [Caudoviricetes sp.]